MQDNAEKTQIVTLETLAGYIPMNSFVPAPDMPVQRNEIVVGTLVDKEKLFLTLSEAAQKTATAISDELNVSERKIVNGRVSYDRKPENDCGRRKFLEQSEICRLFGELLWSSIRERIPIVSRVGAAGIREGYKIAVPLSKTKQGE